METAAVSANKKPLTLSDQNRALSKNISRKGLQNRRSLGFARDDKKERVVIRRRRLLMGSRPNNRPCPFPGNVFRQCVAPYGFCVNQ